MAKGIAKISRWSDGKISLTVTDENEQRLHTEISLSKDQLYELLVKDKTNVEIKDIAIFEEEKWKRISIEE
jgi:hypothetical protein